MDRNYENVKKMIGSIEKAKNADMALALCKRLLEHCEFLRDQIDARDDLIRRYNTMTKELIDMV